jgi:hypothetical protein
VNAPTKLLPGEGGKPAFDEVDPRGARHAVPSVSSNVTKPRRINARQRVEAGGGRVRLRKGTGVFEDIVELWESYTAAASKTWPGDVQDLAAEMRNRLRRDKTPCG